mgnify:CR=1 FL=1
MRRRNEKEGGSTSVRPITSEGERDKASER